ncbi:MAG: DUF2332 family protein [Pseudomonadota bacterium]
MSGSADVERRVRDSFLRQAQICSGLGSAFMENLLSGLATTLDASTVTGERILSWQGSPEPEKDALALRLTGAIHAIVRRGEFPHLSAFYEHSEITESTEGTEITEYTESTESPEFMEMISGLIRERDEEINTWLDFAPQTNEVARSAIIFVGLQNLAERFHCPMHLHELGCSGGLNLQAAGYGYQFGPAAYGNARSALQLKPNWEGALPPSLSINVEKRMGCDLNPLYVDRAEHREKLLAYLWPDQPARLKRVETAIRIAQESPPELEQNDAATWVEQKFSKSAETETLSVLFHTIAWNYFPERTKNRITDIMADAGARATASSPLAWLSFEFDAGAQPLLKLNTWPGGEECILASADPHVHAIKYIK